MATIYLSSTFEDLKVHRRAVGDTLRQLGHAVRSMEDYTASPEPPLDTSEVDSIVAWATRSEIADRETRRAALRLVPNVKTALRLLDVASMSNTDPPPVAWIAEPVLVRGAVTMLAGREGTGKSALALALASSVGRGVPLGHIRSPNQATVLYVDAENSGPEIHRRVHGLRADPARLSYAEADGFDLHRDLDQLIASGFAVVRDEREAIDGDGIGGPVVRRVTAAPDAPRRGRMSLDERRPWQPAPALTSLTLDFDLTGPEQTGLSRAERRHLLEAA